MRLIDLRNIIDSALDDPRFSPDSPVVCEDSEGNVREITKDFYYLYYFKDNKELLHYYEKQHMIRDKGIDPDSFESVLVFSIE